MPGGPARTTLALLAILGVLPGSADAVGQGSPGKVATVAAGGPVRIWDPVAGAKDPAAGWTTIAEKGSAGVTEGSVSLISRPQWSRDGTRLVFTQAAPDPGDVPEGQPVPYTQTSIYLYTVATRTVARLTTPDPSLVDKNPDDDRQVGHVVSDAAPTFSPDGTTVAFVRSVRAEPDDELKPHDGMQVWTVPAGGGQPARRTSLGEDSALSALQWIPGTQDLLAVQFTPDGVDGARVARISLGGGAAPIANTSDTAPFGLDVSPDGRLFTYTGLTGSGFRAHVRPLSGGPDIAAFDVPDFPTFSPTGNGILSQGCIDERCGLVEKYAFETETARDIPEGETEQLVLAGYSSQSTIMDVQPQQLPIVFLPGFLGSVIACGDDSLWPGEFATLPEPLDMQLAPDGITNTGCSGTKATGEPVRRVAGLDIYAGVSDYIAERFGDRAAVLGWDWRKRPQETLLELDAKIDELLARDGLGKRQGVGRAVLWGHSYGGMLIRTYLATMRPEKVARVLTLGTPYWGSPKAIFPLAFGVETPLDGPGLDLFFRNRELKQLARNLGGLYQLLPSPRLGSWLTVDGRAQPVGSVLAGLGANTSLFAEAQGYHRGIYDGFFDNGGRIDVRAVVGTGEASIGSVDLRPRPKGTDGVGVGWVNGDATVPAKSAMQGPGGKTKPLGDQVHMQFTCGVEHVALANDEGILRAYTDWLDFGAVPGALKRAPCPFTANELEFTPGTLGAEDPGQARAAAADMTLAQAEQAGLAQVVEGGGRVRVLTNPRQPVRLRLRLRRAVFTSRALPRGATLTYGPVSGTVRIAPGARGKPPAVTVGGRRVKPRRIRGGRRPTAAKPLGPLRFTSAPRWAGTAIVARVRVPSAGTLVSSARVGDVKVASSRSRAARAGVVGVRVTLPVRLQVPVVLRVVLRGRGGGRRTVSAPL